MVRLTTLENFNFFVIATAKSAVFPLLVKTSEVFCVADVVCSVFGKMAAVLFCVFVDFSRNNHLNCVESETINTPSR